MGKYIGATGLAYLWGKITSSLSGKESKREIVAIVNPTDASLPITSLSCELGKYYRIDVAVETLVISLPVPSDMTYLNKIKMSLSTGTSPSIIFIASDINNVSPHVYANDGFAFTANRTYEITIFYNGAYWVVSGIEIDKTDIQPIVKYTVSGIVTDGINSLSGVEVTLGEETVTTGADGAFTFTNLNVGIYTLSASKNGYSFKGISIAVSSDITQNIEMLPYDAEVEYLESTGTQYIDTGIYGTPDLYTELVFQVLANQTSTGVFGCYAGNNAYYLYQSTGTPKWQVGLGTYTNTSKQTDLLKHTIEFDNYKVRLDNEQIASFSRDFTTTPRTLLLMACRNGTSGIYTMTPQRLYSCKMLKNGITLKDYIPVRKNGVGYLYDKVSKTLYANAGSDTFTYGNDKS